MIQFDYQSILNRLREDLNSRLGNSGMLFFSTNQRLLETVAEELAEQARYNEYLTRESKWTLAQNLSSIMSQIDFFGYKPHRKIGASGELVISANSSFSGSWAYNISIPKFSEFSNGNLTFTSSSNEILYNTDNSVTIPVVQGSVQTQTFTITSAYTSSELSGLTLEIDDASFENNLYEVRVNGVLWAEVDYFGEATSVTDTLFILKSKIDFSGVKIQFGNSYSSKQLETGDIVTVKYIRTAGDLGEVLELNNVTQTVSTFTDSREVIVPLYCNNESQITGGFDYENIETIRENAPLTFKIGSRIISRQDYTAFINDLNIADKVVVWGEAETNTDAGNPIGTYIAVQENLVNVSGFTYDFVTSEATPLSEVEQNEIYDAIVDVKPLTDILTFIDPIITYFDMDVTAYYNADNYTSSQVVASVTDALEEEYSILNHDFKQSLYFSQYFGFISNISTILHHVTTLTLYQFTTAIEASESAGDYSFFFPFNVHHDDIKANSIKFYVKSTDSTINEDHIFADWYLIGSDDGSGGLTSETIPTTSISPDVPDQGETFDLSFESEEGDPTQEINYTNGTVFSSFGTNPRIVIGKGIPHDWLTSGDPDYSDSFRVKIEFEIDGSNVEIIPKLRYQTYTIGNISVTPVAGEVVT